MAKYRLEKQLPSTFVDKNTLRELEDYLTKRIPKKIGLAVGNEAIQDEFEFNITIHDKYGKEELNSIADIHRDKFANDVQRIDLTLSTNYRLIEIGISFSKGRPRSSLDIFLNAENGKEVALGICHEIEQLLNERKTIHFIFHGIYDLIATIFLPASLLILFTFRDVITTQNYPVIVTFVGLLVLSYLLIKLISPYSTFDTKRQEQIKSFSRWILHGLAGVFLFGVIANLVKDHLLP